MEGIRVSEYGIRYHTVENKKSNPIPYTPVSCVTRADGGCWWTLREASCRRCTSCSRRLTCSRCPASSRSNFAIWLGMCVWTVSIVSSALNVWKKKKTFLTSSEHQGDSHVWIASRVRALTSRYEYICTYIHIYINKYMYTYICLYSYIQTNSVNEYTYIHTYTHIHICIRTRILKYIQTFLKNQPPTKFLERPPGNNIILYIYINFLHYITIGLTRFSRFRARIFVFALTRRCVQIFSISLL